ncbi:hypothetical protein P153DRAFT_281533 [Dothidotthia symphoricarpi CBS 119687]|uniref:Zinc finger C2H2 LYAR-type domain-containing protein n=1 Tax=Dothidotthia symphoricarpi CBS 119687 TaxID=1392245 RepID=A0A6A6AS84_9PLEO|nr:uncharacterized protein P153DRAFT_281533 [Dothidotthia symphoricarpi CBS 119687]KAF2134018.1 hypothetical protein P153DRAFT_281533 [Dothidotthia symphoricarpi CBS 119687]
MVSFSCENCGDVLTKKKLDGHRNQCYGASYTCLDCMVHFPGMSYKSHTACITEDQKYQGKLYKEKKPKGQQQQNNQQQYLQDLTPRNAYVEDASEAYNAIAVVDAPPRAPTPPPAPHSLGYNARAALPDVNVFDFLDLSKTPRASRTPLPVEKSRMIEDSQPPTYGNEARNMGADVLKFQVSDNQDFVKNGFAYGEEAVRPSNERYDSYATPAPKSKQSKSKSKDVETSTKKSDRKRKRSSPSQIDMALVRAQQERDVMMADIPAELHSGLTGGLSKLLAQPEFLPSPEDSGDYANSPLSPMKRVKQGNSKALMRAQKEWEAQQQKVRKVDTKADTKEEKTREKKDKKEKDRGRERERDRKEHKSSTTLVKIRSKKKRDDSSKEEVRRVRRRQYSSSVSPAPQERKAIEYPRSASSSPAPDDKGQLIVRPNGALTPVMTDPRAELFLSFITKGPDSERGMSINKALKRYHRECHEHLNSEPTKPEEEKELWKNIRLRKNERGEVVLFFAPPETS